MLVLKIYRSCHVSKSINLPFNKGTIYTKTAFDFMFSDIWGPASQPTKGGSIYFIVSVDAYSQDIWVYLMKTSISCMIYIYISFAHIFLLDLATSSLIKEPFSDCPYTLEQYGIAEQKHHHPLDFILLLVILLWSLSPFGVKLSLLFLFLSIALHPLFCVDAHPLNHSLIRNQFQSPSL